MYEPPNTPGGGFIKIPPLLIVNMPIDTRTLAHCKSCRALKREVERRMRRAEPKMTYSDRVSPVVAPTEPGWTPSFEKEATMTPIDRTPSPIEA